jgi:hypothetical protein
MSQSSKSKASGEGHSGDAYFFESENDRRMDQLYGKVSELKYLTINIGEEVERQSGLLDTMNKGMNKTMDTVGRAIYKVKDVMSKGAGTTTFRHILYVVLCVFFIMILLYFFGRR